MLKCSNELMSCTPIRAKKALKCDQMAPCVLVIGANDENRGCHLVLGWLLVSSSCAPALLLVCAQFRASLPRCLLNYIRIFVLAVRCTKGSAEARWTSLKFYQASLFVRFALSVVGHLRAKGKPTTDFFVCFGFCLVRFIVFLFRLVCFVLFVFRPVCFVVFVAVLFASSFASRLSLCFFSSCACCCLRLSPCAFRCVRRCLRFVFFVLLFVFLVVVFDFASRANVAT